jgi:hypothetical protein
MPSAQLPMSVAPWQAVCTYSAIWTALVLYAISVTTLMVRGREAGQRIARLTWTLGLLAYLVHLACAFEFYHHRSHAAAVKHTAERTYEVVGVAWGEGIWGSHFFTALWIVDGLWWWLLPEAYRRRSLVVQGLVHGFFAFMIFNATVVFGSTPARITGVVGTVLLSAVALVMLTRRQR